MIHSKLLKCRDSVEDLIELHTSYYVVSCSEKGMQFLRHLKVFLKRCFSTLEYKQFLTQTSSILVA